MDPKMEKKINETAKLARENHRLLKKINHRLQMEHIWRILKVVVIVAMLLGAYYAVKPFLQNLQNSYSEIIDSIEEINKTKNSFTDGITSLLDGIKGEQ